MEPRRPTCYDNPKRSPGYYVMVRDYQPSGEFSMRLQYFEDKGSIGCHLGDLPECAGCPVEKYKEAK